MGKITQKLPSKDEIPKPKRRHRRKDLDDIHSRILKNKRKSDYEQNTYNKDRRKKPNSSKNLDKHIRLLHTGIFKNGTKSKNIKKNKDAKGKLESVVSKARLVGDVLKLFDGDSETICISESATEDEITNQLRDKPASQSNKKLIKDNLTRKLYTLKKSPVLGKNQRKYRTKCLEDTSKKDKEAVIVFEPIDIPEVIIDQNFRTKKTMMGRNRNDKKKEVTRSEYSTITSSNRDLNDSYMKLCAKLSDEYKNVLSCIEDPLSATRKKLKEISNFPQSEYIQHETTQELSNSKSPTLSEHQACVYSSDAESLTVQFPENQNSINCSPENNRHNKKKISDFSINGILSMGTNSQRNERCFDISIIRNKHSKMLMKKQVLITTPRRELPMQFDDEKITRDYNLPNNIPQKYSKETDRLKSTNEQFYEGDFVNMFQNLPTPSTVNRQFDRLKQAEFQNKSKNQNIKAKYSERFEEPCTHLYADVPNKEDEFIQFRNYMCSQAPLEVLTAAATFVEAGHLPQDQVGKQHVDRHIPISSNCKSFDQQPPPFYCLQNTGSSNLNIEPAKQNHCANQNTCRSEGHIYFNCSNCSHQRNISQAYHQNYAKTAQRTIASGCSYFPICYNRVASNYINLPNNAGHARVLPLIPNHDSYTYLQQVDDHQRVVCSQNFSQPVKYFALDNSVNVHKIPLYVKDSICKCQDHGHSSICPH